MRAGFGTALITPGVPVRLAGFGDRTEPALRVHDELEVRALYIEDGRGTGVCLLVFDLLGMSAGFASPIRDAVAAELGIARSGVITSCTHTHEGPNAMEGGEQLGWPIPAGYRETLVARSVEAAHTARIASEPVELFATSVPLPDGVSYNRRGLPYEPWFCVLDLRRPDGSRAGVLANLAIHPVLLGSPWLAVSTDWPGPFRSALEHAAGGTAIMLSGALGDVNPTEHHSDVPTHLDEAVHELQTLANVLARATVAAFDRCTPVSGKIDISANSVTVRPDATLLGQLLNAAEVSIDLIEWKIGDVQIVAVPGEAFHALGRAITDARAGITLIAGLAPTWEGYLPVPYGDGYEETVSLGAQAVGEIARALTGSAR